MKEEGHAVKIRRISIVFLVCAVCSVALATMSYAEDGPKLPLKRYEGQIKSIKIDRCGMEPGQCIGSIILAQKGGGQMELGIRPGTWLKRGGNYIFIEDLETYIKVAEGFAYDPYWDLDSVLDMCIPQPTFYPPWQDFGLGSLTPEVLKQRVDAYLERVLMRT
jgi:hypothetical protein